MTYRNSSDNPSTLTRTVQFVVNDGVASSAPVTRAITVSTVNDAPVLAALEAVPLNYTENQPATALTASLTVSDADNATLTGAAVQITGNYTSGQDVLGYSNTGSISGSFDFGLGTLTLSGTDTLDNYQAALRAVTYHNTSDNPSTQARTVQFVGNDGLAISAPVTRSITVNAVAAAPSISIVRPNPVVGSNSRQTITINGANFVNKPGVTLTWTAPPLPPTGGYTVPDAQVNFVSSTELQISITTTATADTWTVKVTNPDGQHSNVASFQVNAPTMLTADQVAQAAYAAGFRGGTLVNAVAVARAESDFVLEAHCLNCLGVPEDSRGLWRININVHPQYDGQLLLTSASYNASAAFDISDAAINANWTPWSTFNDQSFVNWLTLARNAAQNIDSTVIRAINDRVSATTAIKVRPTAGDASDTRTVRTGTTGTVLDGPVVATISTATYRFIWWKIHWDDGGSDGWSVEDYMSRKTEATPILSVTPTSASVSANAGFAIFNVNNTGGGTMNYSSSIVSGADWLSIASGGSGVNSGTMSVSYAANTGAQRSGTIVVTASGASGSSVTSRCMHKDLWLSFHFRR